MGRPFAWPDGTLWGGKQVLPRQRERESERGEESGERVSDAHIQSLYEPN